MNPTARRSMHLISPVIVTTCVLAAWAPGLFAINPQPEPPGDKAPAPAIRTSPGVDALGPQPEPPDKPAATIKKVTPQSLPPDIPNPGTKSLGPQSEPPDKELKLK